MIRRWWPVPTLLVAVVTVQVLVSSRYEARGHADAHLSSSTVIYGVTFLAGVVIVALRGPLWRRPALWLTSGAVVASSAIVTMANLRVVDAIDGENWSDADAARLGPTRPGFAAGHDLAGHAAWVTVGSTAAFALWLWRNRGLSNRAALAAIAVTLLVPPWTFPGAGLAVIAGATVIGQERQRRSTMTPIPPNAEPFEERRALACGLKPRDNGGPERSDSQRRP